ncbi:MAG: hotdog fold thioesterase [Deltaproteobacteria bacterium]|nr:hotdog fold thioesterase [Deltaproteobacteria bacterium]
MDPKIKEAIFQKAAAEPFGRKFGLQLTDLEDGYSRVEMTLTPDMNNIFDLTHGGAIFALIDEAFQTACNSHGTMAVALSMSLTYIAPPRAGSRLTAEAREYSRTRKTATYEIKVSDAEGSLIAVCQALAYRKGIPLPFLPSGPLEK